MRRLLLFALVFGLGLGLLVLIGRLRGGGDGEEPGPAPPPAVEPGDEPMVPIPGGEGDEDDPSLFRASGRWEWSRFDPEDPEAAHPLYKLVAQVRFAGDDLHELTDITLDLNDARTGEVRATMSAERGEARIVELGGRPTPDGPVNLSEVELTILGGGPFVPMTLYVPRLRVLLDERVFRSDDRVTLRGNGMEAESLGIELREEDGLLRLLRDGAVDLTLEDGSRAELEATGAGEIALERLGETGDGRPERAQVVVTGGALLVLEGRESLRSESERLVISGRMVEGALGERFVLQSATASGGADLRRVADTFTGERAEFRFDASGRPTEATLTGGPRAAVWVDADLEGREDARRVRIELAGPGPLTTRFRPGDEGAGERAVVAGGFELEGGGEIRVPALDLVVTANERISGDVQAEHDAGHVELEGEVVALFEGSEFRGPSLTLDFSRDLSRVEAGEPRVEGYSPGPSRLSGTDPRGRELAIEAGGEARWVLRGGELEVPLARRAKLTVADPDGYVAEAGVLRDFRQATQSFVAEEGAEYRSARGSTSAPRVVARGPGRVEFQGSEEERAVVNVAADPERGVESGTLRALTIERDGARVIASAEVELELAAREGRHELDCDWLELSSPALEAGADVVLPATFRVRARGVERAELAGEFGRAGLTGRELELDGRFLAREEGADPEAPPPAEVEQLVVTGDVEVDFEDEARFAGRGERFVWTPAEGGRLEGSAAERARAWGRLSARDLPYRMSAERIEFDEEHLNALWPQIVLDEALPDPEAPGDVLIGASSEWMSADAGGVLFSGVAHLVGRLSSGRDWKLNAGAVHLFLHEEEQAEPGPAGALRQVVAWDGFSIELGDDLRATGQLVDADFETMHMEGRPARLELLGFAWESTSIDYQLTDTLIRTEQGTLSGASGSEMEGWTLRYESLRPFETLDSTILAVRNPVFSHAQRAEEVRADWALFWVDRDRWRARTEDWLRPAEEEELRAAELEEAPPEVQTETPNLFGRFETGRISKLLTEVYVEGNVEYTRAGRRMARVDSLYLDMVDGHGWLQNAEVLFDFDVSNQSATLVARAEWMRHSADGSLHADNAIATTCTFAEPHFFVRTRDLRLTPSPEEGVTWRVSLRKNSLKFDNGLGLPLPGFSYDSDEEGKPIFDRLVFGNSARFGSFVSATVNGSLGAAGDAVSKISGSPIEDVDGRIRYRASFLGLRGFLLGAGIEAEAADKFWMNLYADGIPDGAEDRGIVRVPVDDRPDFRYFIRGRARYLMTEREWFDFALATQSDPGAQSEFFEDEFLYYEQRDNFVHWRKGEDGDYRSATVRFRADEFRNYVSELPAGIIYEGAAPLSTVGAYPLLYSANTDYGLYRRLVGTSDIRSPFDPFFADTTAGDVDILRLDTTHRFEVPIPLDLDGWTVSPFTDVRGTAWSETVDEEGGAARVDLVLGAEASSTYVRTSAGGRVHTLTPTIGVRSDVASADTGDQPFQLDEVEDPRKGQYFDLGLRSRWWEIGTEEQLTIDVRSTHGFDVEGDEPDGWLGVALLGELVTRIGKVPVVVNQDGRYDLEEGNTFFSRSRVGFAPIPTVGFEFGFGTGRDRTDERLYEAITAGARWRATEKWEFEGRQTIDLVQNSQLDTRFLLRRYGHDIVFEFEIGTREAEGTSFSIGVRPALGFRRARLGLIERWMVDNY